MHVHHGGSAPATTAPEPTFTGDVTISGYFRRAAPSGLTGATVTFSPGARTPWKVGPAGQTIVVCGGAGRAQCEGGDVVELRTGDVVWFPPGERHWEGATPDEGLTYVAVQEAAVEFGESVTDEQYRGTTGRG